MKLTLAEIAKSKWSLAGLASAIVILPNIGKGLDAVGYLIQTPSVAYAAKQTAEKVDEQFERYIERQDAVAEALNSYVQQQQRQQLPMTAPAPEARQITEEDDTGCWTCWGYGREDCFQNQRWERCP